ncbi:MAG: putative toxin-antitoxin system toxin component, PIN family [Arcicella sp.]|nr:putative toxin-antitoxin system toxin component, PIN family [Arcicella sp.]
MNQLFIIDTNTLVSAVILPNSTPKKAFDKAQENGFLVFSEATFAELSEVICRTKFDKYLPLEKRLNFIKSLRESSLLIEITTHVTDCRDPKDDKFLDLALAAQAHYIITGDQDLLVLHPYHNTMILTAADFLVNFD